MHWPTLAMATALASLFIAGLPACSSGDTVARSLPLEPCRLEAAYGLQSAEALCGTLPVPENRDAPHDAAVDLRVAVVRTIRDAPGAEPLFVLSGGPGQAATDFYAGYAPAFEPIARDRDIVLVDQRGTGTSNRLECGSDAHEPRADSVEPSVLRERAAACLDRLSFDPRQYTTSVAVRDLDAVRAALGYERIALYGISYGTRVAQHYLRRHPERVTAIVLDGVVPMDLALGPDIAPGAERALDAILGRCARTTDCAAAFEDVRGTFDTLLARLREAPVEVTFPDPTSAVPIGLAFGADELGAAVRILSYSDETAAMLPLLLDAAGAADNLDPLAAQYVMVARRLEGQLAEGMHHSVVCTEDVPFVPVDAPESNAVTAAYLGAAQLDGLLAICSVWPRGVLDPDLRTPLEIEVPLLLLSGEVDPITPPAYAERVLAQAANARHIVVPARGHGQLATPCVARLVARFLATHDVERLDAGCIQQLEPAPFLLEFTGAAP